MAAQGSANENPGSVSYRVSHDPVQHRHHPKHVQLDLSSRPERPLASNSFLRSYSQSSFRSPARSRRSSGFASPAVGTPRGSVSTISLQQLIERLELDQYDTYGVEELRGGFFDASFFRPLDKAKSESERISLQTSEEPQQEIKNRDTFDFLHPLKLLSSIYNFILLLRTRRGTHIIKSFLSYYLAYILCLIPVTQQWLGRHSYFATISVLFNHSGRTFGAQIDGFMLCVLGAAVGLAWGCLALELSNGPNANEPGLKGVVAILLILFSVIIAWLRSSLVRLYQAIMSAGLAVYYTCLLEPNEPEWSKRRIWEFAIPWLAGQIICLIVNVIVIPGAGGKEIAVALNQALMSALDVLVLPRTESPELRQALNMNLVALSEAVRDMRSELTITPFRPDDVERLRNTLQSVMRDLMAISTETTLFDLSEPSPSESLEEEESSDPEENGIELPYRHRNQTEQSQTRGPALTGMNLVREVLSLPTRELINAMVDSITSCNNALMEVAGHPELSLSSTIHDEEARVSCQHRLESAMEKFDEADVSLIDHPMLPTSYSHHPDLVKLFLFIHPVRQAADSVSELAIKMRTMTSLPSSKSLKFFLPNYPWKRALNRSNPQVRHDRGGMTAGYYFRSKKLLDEAIGKVAARTFVSDSKLKEQKTERENNGGTQTMAVEEVTIRNRIWRLLHRLQEFESRFAFKFALITSLLALPGYLENHKGWYFKNEGWWAVAAAWFTMHPRVGGNAQDLITRSFLAALGAMWGSLAYAARSGNPYVMAVFALLFMFPAIIRLTQSSHPRSGLMACVSFSVVSLTTYNLDGGGASSSLIQIAWTRMVAIVVGIFAAVFINWCLWPFVARHELRKSISAMMLHLAISYRGIVTRYIYHDHGVGPSEEDVRMSQIQESRLREGFFRIRELLGMTRHEIRLRGPFNPTPYMALINTCECFFEHLVEVRQSSLYFQPFSLIGEPEYNKVLLSVRRDAVASIIMNLTTMSGALRVKAPIPIYLPSAAVARKRLLDKMAEIEREREKRGGVPKVKPEKSRRWADVYQFAYSTALTDIVGQLEQLEALVKEIVGEMELDVRDI